MGFIFASGGSASICGLDICKKNNQIKKITGYVPSDVRLYSDMRVKELLIRNAAFYSGDFSDEINRLCESFEVDINKRFNELSTGNKKKVSIICALMTNPKIIILDEPTNGLDPMMQKRLFEELKIRTKNGSSVLLSSHNLSEVQEYCNRVAFIKSGSILAVIDLAKDFVQTKIITVVGEDEEVPIGFEFLSRENGKRIFRTELNGNELIKALDGLNLTDFTVENESIDAHFWSLYGKESVV